MNESANEHTAARSKWAGRTLLVAVVALGAVLSWLVAQEVQQNAENASQGRAIERQAEAHCQALNDIHNSLIAFVHEHNRITRDLHKVGVHHEMVDLRDAVKPLKVECDTRRNGFKTGGHHGTNKRSQGDSPRNPSAGAGGPPSASPGGGSSSSPTGSSPPTPPPSGGGGSGNPNPPSNPPPSNPPPSNPPPPNNPPSGGLLDPVVDGVCDLTGPILSLPAVCR